MWDDFHRNSHPDGAAGCWFFSSWVTSPLKVSRWMLKVSLGQFAQGLFGWWLIVGRTEFCMTLAPGASQVHDCKFFVIWKLPTESLSNSQPSNLEKIPIIQILLLATKKSVYTALIYCLYSGLTPLHQSSNGIHPGKKQDLDFRKKNVDRTVHILNMLWAEVTQQHTGVLTGYSCKLNTQRLTEVLIWTSKTVLGSIYQGI